ncbi:MAG TPA: hypothetical protein VKO83_08405 [Steroidobacteraceae bacterium]|nr:hypothetical protein [Steroidobacteraceae bacterium]
MKSNAVFIAAMGLLCLQSAHAGPADYVYTPTVEKGEREIDFKSGTQDSDPRKSVGTLGFGYGANDWWFTEVYVKGAKEGGDFKYDAFEWENKFQLSETGKYPVDVGFITEIEVPREREEEGIELKIGPLFQTEFGKLQLNGNVLFEDHVDAAESSPTEMGYQWQVKYRWKPALEYGLQGFGELGPWDDWEPSDEQSHKAGPAVFGKFAAGSQQAIKYNAAWLIGVSDGAPDNTVRLQVEYEF